MRWVVTSAANVRSETKDVTRRHFKLLTNDDVPKLYLDETRVGFRTSFDTHDRWTFSLD